MSGISDNPVKSTLLAVPKKLMNEEYFMNADIVQSNASEAVKKEKNWPNVSRSLLRTFSNVFSHAIRSLEVDLTLLMSNCNYLFR